ncbi:MAG TPA: thiamine diphosphokinase [Ilumatobacter sp.]|nr:thiamine diphosphokinase [Ilumatobacter sp.]
MTPVEQVEAALRAGYEHHVVVVTGAEPLRPEAVADLPDGALVLAADGGLDHALAAGLRPAGVVGDLDSITPAGLAWATEHATISRHDPAKDHTDTELALDMAADLNPARLTMLAGGGDRLDHTLAALGALARPSLTSVPRLEAWWGNQRIQALHGPGRTSFTDLAAGSTLSLVAIGGPCEGVTSTGVRWPLTAFTLDPLSGLGVSNEVVDETVTVSVTSGVLLVFVPTS